MDNEVTLLFKKYLGTTNTEVLNNEKDILEKSKREGTQFLLYRDLKELKTSNNFLSSAALKDISDRYKQNLAFNTIYSNYVFQLANQIGDDIDLILLKGIGLINTVYEDAGLRNIGDIDILVRQKDLNKLLRHLDSLGYKTGNEMGDVEDLSDQDAIICSSYLKSSMPFLHIHRHLLTGSFPAYVNGASLDMEKIWKKKISLNGHRNLYVMSPTHQIIYLCHHGLKHSFDKFIRLFDIDRTIRHYSSILDWDNIIKETDNFNLGRPLYYGLNFAKQICGSPIPDEVIGKLKPKDTTYLERRFIQYILNSNSRSRYSSIAVYLAMNRSLISKLKFIFLSVSPQVSIRRTFLKRFVIACKHISSLGFSVIRTSISK